MLLIAFPDAGVLKVCNLLRATLWAGHLSIRPSNFDHELFAVLEIGEVYNRFLKRVRNRCLFHDPNVAWKARSVKYIIALPCGLSCAKSKGRGSVLRYT